MADFRSIAIRNLMASLRGLNQPKTWGSGLALLLSLWVLIDYVPSPDSSSSPPIEASSTVSNALEPNVTEEPVDDSFVHDLNDLLKDPTVAKYGVNETDETVQLDLLNRLLTSPFASSTTTATSSSSDRSTMQFDATEEESPEVESATSTQSSLLSSSSRNRPITHPGLYHRSQTAIRPIIGQKSTIDRRFSRQTAKLQNPWQVDFSTGSATPAENSSPLQQAGQGNNSAWSAPAAAPAVGPRGSLPQSIGQSSHPTQTATSLNSTTDRTPPAMRIPATSRSSFSPSSTFTTSQSSQIIQTFQPTLETPDTTTDNSIAMP